MKPKPLWLGIDHPSHGKVSIKLEGPGTGWAAKVLEREYIKELHHAVTPEIPYTSVELRAMKRKKV